MRRTLLTVLALLVLAPPASAQIARTLVLDRVEVDKSTIGIFPLAWSVSQTSATWDPPAEGCGGCGKGEYTWSLPKTLASSGATATIQVSATDDSGGRHNAGIVVSPGGGIAIEDGPAEVWASADKNAGTPVDTQSKTFTLKPGAVAEGQEVVVAVGLAWEGPRILHYYKRPVDGAVKTRLSTCVERAQERPTPGAQRRSESKCHRAASKRKRQLRKCNRRASRLPTEADEDAARANCRRRFGP